MGSGSIFFAKKIRTLPTSRKRKIFGDEITCKGHMIGLCLGYVVPDGECPTSDTIKGLIVEAGAFPGDDIMEVLGADAFKKLYEHTKVKYK